MHPVLRSLVVVLLLGVGVGLAEIGVRIVRPRPRRMLVAAERVGGFREAHGVLLWDGPSSDRSRREAALHDVDCAREGARVVLAVGSSITHGVEVPTAQVASRRLKDALQAASPDRRVCVVNLGVPGFSTAQAAARGLEALDTMRPDVVLLELWGGPPIAPVRVGDHAYFFRGLARDAQGLANPYGLPPGLNRALLERVALYRYAVVNHADDCPGCRTRLGPDVAVVDAFVARARGVGAAVVAWRPVYLDTPPAAMSEGARLERAVWAPWLARFDGPVVDMAEVLDGVDPAPLRVDPVHLSAAGHAVLAEAWLDAVGPLVAP